jgi:superfamily II DNA or RNA helicase
MIAFVFLVQIGAIMSGIQPGLTMVVGPPGTGKTDTAVQIMNVLYHNCPSQRTLIITHSNQALNDLFEKIMQVLGLKYIHVDIDIKTSNLDSC